jgi:hypothetical protein
MAKQTTVADTTKKIETTDAPVTENGNTPAQDATQTVTPPAPPTIEELKKLWIEAQQASLSAAIDDTKSDDDILALGQAAFLAQKRYQDAIKAEKLAKIQVENEKIAKQREVVFDDMIALYDVFKGVEREYIASGKPQSGIEAVNKAHDAYKVAAESIKEVLRNNKGNYKDATGKLIELKPLVLPMGTTGNNISAGTKSNGGDGLSKTNVIKSTLDGMYPGTKISMENLQDYCNSTNTFLDANGKPNGTIRTAQWLHNKEVAGK